MRTRSCSPRPSCCVPCLPVPHTFRLLRTLRACSSHVSVPGVLGAGALASIPGEAGGVHIEDLVNVSCLLASVSRPASCVAPIRGKVHAASWHFFSWPCLSRALFRIACPLQHLNDVCAQVVAEWEGLQVRASCRTRPSLLMPVLSVFRGASKDEGFTARPLVQRQKPDAVAAFNTNLASILRILVNFTFLFDTAKDPQHAR